MRIDEHILELHDKKYPPEEIADVLNITIKIVEKVLDARQ